MKWFKNVTTAEKLRKEYRRLLKLYHPDNENGSVEVTQEINADIEIIGSWVWVQGGYEYRELLKSTGFKYAPKKKSWCWHYGEYRRYHNKEVSLDEIRMKYGSQSVSHKSKQYVLN